MLPLVIVCSSFMIGRNVFSLIFKIKDFFSEEKRKVLKENSRDIFVYFALILTALLGLVSGIGMLLPNQIFGHYLYFIVSGMMVYSYISYAGKTFQGKNWIMFVVSIVVILLTITLAILLSYYMITGIID